MPRLISSPTAITVTDLPAWVPAPGQYATVSLANAASVDPCPARNCAYSGVNGFESIWIAWNGGAYAPLLGAYGSMLFFGGGHYAYDGNCVVAYDVAARRWSLLSQPSNYNTRSSGDNDSTNVLVDQDGTFPDGTPFPNHTNMGCDYLPPAAGGGPLGSYVFMGHDNTGVNITRSNLWRFDLQARTWSRWTMPMRLGDLCSLVYDPKRRGLWWFAPYLAESYYAGPLWFIDVVNRALTRVGINSVAGRLGPDIYMPGLTYVASRDCLLLPRNGPGLDIQCVDLASLVLGPNCWAPSFNIRQSGAKCRSLWTYPDGGSSSAWQNHAASDQLEYCAEDGCAYALDLYSSGPCNLHRLQPPAAGQLESGTWTWSLETLAARTNERLALRSLPYGLGTDTRLYGKMRFVPPIRSFAISDHDRLPVQALRPKALG